MTGHYSIGQFVEKVQDYKFISINAQLIGGQDGVDLSRQLYVGGRQLDS